MKKLIIELIIAAFIFSACKNDESGVPSRMESAHISGKLENGSGHPVLIQKILSDRFQTIDSIMLNEQAEFKTSIEVPRPGFYAIRNKDGNYISFLAKKNDSLRITSNYHNINKFTISGSEEAEEITKLHRATQAFLEEVATYARIVSDSVNSPHYTAIKLETDKKYRAAFNELKNFSKEFIEQNEGSLIALMALTNQPGNNIFVFHPVEDYDLFYRVDSVLMKKYPQSEAVKKVHSRLKMIKKKYPQKIDHPEKGDIAPDFSLKDPENNTVQLSDLRGKIVLLDFWASWCAPCRKENRKLREIYNEFHSGDFEIFQVSLDSEYEDWKRGIEEDELDWLHGSELNFWDSSVAEIYGVNSIPANFLIGREGKIVARNISPEEINNKLKELLTKPVL